MNTLCKLTFLVFCPLILFMFLPLQRSIVLPTAASPTPTCDPLDEPPLPENPTEYELGRNLYWHWCMTCHGDRGQGLTDEFRGIWEPEHQNCWGRGCHAGRPGDEGFPIPTVVPALVDEAHLVQFRSVEDLSTFLKATHPPQSPGILQDNEYHSIAVFVFTMNERPLIDIPLTKTPVVTSVSTSTTIPVPASRTFPASIYAVVIFAVLVIGVFVLAAGTHLQK